MAQRLSAGNPRRSRCSPIRWRPAPYSSVSSPRSAHSRVRTFNPAVSFADSIPRRTPLARKLPAYWLSQIAGALVGVALANVMFGLPVFFTSQHARTGPISPGWPNSSQRLGWSGRDLGMRPLALGTYAARRCSLHRCRVLVYRVHVICQSRGDDRALAIGYLRGDPPAGRTRSSYSRSWPGAAVATYALSNGGTVSENRIGPGARAARWSNPLRRDVLFVCVHNGARSQMAEAFLNERPARTALGLKVRGWPRAGNPQSARRCGVMAEAGIDISSKRTKSVRDVPRHR